MGLSMAFVEEEISDEDSRAVNWSDFVDYDNQWRPTPTYWVVDRDRKLFSWSIHRRLPGSPMSKFGLWLDGKVVYVYGVQTYLEYLVEGEKNCEVRWDDVVFDISQISPWVVEDVMAIVKEVLEAYVDGIHRVDLYKTHVNFR